MVLRRDVKNEETYDVPYSGVYKKKNIYIYTFFLFFLIGLLSWNIYAIIKILKLEEELNSLKTIIIQNRHVSQNNFETDTTDYNTDDITEDYDSVTYPYKRRHKRDIIAATQDGVLINSESYAERKLKNGGLNRIPHSQRVSITPLAGHTSSYGDSPTWLSTNHYTSSFPFRSSVPIKIGTSPPPPILNRKSRVMHRDDASKAFRRVVKKSSLKAGDIYDRSNEQQYDSDFTIVHEDSISRRPRPRNQTYIEYSRYGRIKPLPSVQYSGDTSKYVLGQHTNFKGNGHLRHPQQVFVDWKEDNWIKTLGMDQHFSLNNGVVTIRDSGLYLVYAQIFYLDPHDVNGYRVYKNNDTLLQCTTSTHTQHSQMKANTCYTAGVTLFNKGDKVSLIDFSDGRYSLFEPGKSFFGIVKLGDVRTT